MKSNKNEVKINIDRAHELSHWVNISPGKKRFPIHIESYSDLSVFKLCLFQAIKHLAIHLDFAAEKNKDEILRVIDTLAELGEKMEQSDEAEYLDAILSLGTYKEK